MWKFNIDDITLLKGDFTYIIDSYRLPIERKISSFFQNITSHLPNYTDFTVQELIDFFNKEYICPIEEYHSINAVLQYYNLPRLVFDFEKGYTVINHGNIKIIKLLFTNIDHWDKQLSEIYEKPIIIVSDNLTVNKPIIHLYNELKKHYKVPMKYMEQLNNDIEFKTYNTEIEQKEYIDKWLKSCY